MKPSFSYYLSSKSILHSTEQERKRLVTMALGLVASPPLAPKPYERMLLEQFVRGNLSIDQVLTHLEHQEHE
jgi:hypothetical protein